MVISIEKWYAWAPGLETPSDWRNWAEEKMKISDSGAPNLDFLPAMQRRRLSLLSKMAFAAAYHCLDAGSRKVRTVFASRHGEIQRTGNILHDILNKEGVSPTAFSLSVHSATAGLFSIFQENKEPSVTVSARKDTFGSAIVEAAGLLSRDPEEPVLIIAADELLPEELSEFADEVEAPHAVAFLISPGKDFKNTRNIEVNFEFYEKKSNNNIKNEPFPLQFIRWYLSEKQEISIDGERLKWYFKKSPTS
ncbi:MAG: beta-ketoacyl synthase chain length factor [Spirochaetia bacterium]|nr:beta-ketoacyl synthase chain length factor [Spirochaetia bacterium]